MSSQILSVAEKSNNAELGLAGLALKGVLAEATIVVKGLGFGANSKVIMEGVDGFYATLHSVEAPTASTLVVQLPAVRGLQTATNYTRNSVQLPLTIYVDSGNGDMSNRQAISVQIPAPSLGNAEHTATPGRLAIGINPNAPTQGATDADHLGKPVDGSGLGGMVTWYPTGASIPLPNIDLPSIWANTPVGLLTPDPIVMGLLAAGRQAGKVLPVDAWHDDWIECQDPLAPGFIIVWRDDIPSSVVQVSSIGCEAFMTVLQSEFHITAKSLDSADLAGSTPDVKFISKGASTTTELEAGVPVLLRAEPLTAGLTPALDILRDLKIDQYVRFQFAITGTEGEDWNAFPYDASMNSRGTTPAVNVLDMVGMRDPSKIAAAFGDALALLYVRPNLYETSVPSAQAKSNESNARVTLTVFLGIDLQIPMKVPVPMGLDFAAQDCPQRGINEQVKIQIVQQGLGIPTMGLFFADAGKGNEPLRGYNFNGIPLVFLKPDTGIPLDSALKAIVGADFLPGKQWDHNNSPVPGAADAKNAVTGVLSSIVAILDVLSIFSEIQSFPNGESFDALAMVVKRLEGATQFAIDAVGGERSMESDVWDEGDATEADDFEQVIFSMLLLGVPGFGTLLGSYDSNADFEEDDTQCRWRTPKTTQNVGTTTIIPSIIAAVPDFQFMDRRYKSVPLPYDPVTDVPAELDLTGGMNVFSGQGIKAMKWWT